MKKYLKIIGITVTLIYVFSLLTIVWADVGDWSDYDYSSNDSYSNSDYDYSSSDYSSNNNSDEKNNETPSVTDETYTYNKTFDNSVIIPIDGYAYASYSNITPNYYLYKIAVNNENDGTDIIARVKKIALSYAYDIIYDKADNNHTINNPLGKDVKSDSFILTSAYEKLLHEDIYPRGIDDDKYNSYKLNDYYYFKEISENGKVYKVYKDLLKVDFIKFEGMVLNKKDYTYFAGEYDFGDEAGGDYYVNKLTGQIEKISGWTVVIEEGQEWTIPFKFIGKIIVAIFSLIFGISIILGIPVLIVIAVIKRGKNKSKGVKATSNNVELVEENSELLPIEKLEESDANFSIDEFLQWVDSVFMELQAAWTAKDTEKIKILEDTALYATHKSQLERYIKDKKTNYIERIAIQEKRINGYKEDNGYQYIDMTLQVDMVDYIKDDESDEVIKGRTEDRLKMEYNIVFKRFSGIQTKEVGELEKISCPSCGAPIDISASAVCQYCNTVVNTSKHNWVISKYKGRNI